MTWVWVSLVVLTLLNVYQLIQAVRLFDEVDRLKKENAVYRGRLKELEGK